MDLGEQEAVATQTRPEENDQLIGAWAQQKAQPIFGRPEIRRPRELAHMRCDASFQHLKWSTSPPPPSPTTPAPIIARCSQAADAHALQDTSSGFRLTSIPRAQCLESIDETDTPPSTTKTPTATPHPPHIPHHVCACEVFRAPGQGGNTTCQSQVTAVSTHNRNMHSPKDNTSPVVRCNKQDITGQAILCQRITAHGHPR